MASGPDTQLEKAINKALKSGDSQPLAEFLKWDIHEGTHIHCSEQFLTKLDKLISRSLDQSDCQSATLGLTVIQKCGKHLKLTRGCQGLPGMIAQGLPTKMVLWFEKCRQLWIQYGPRWNETLLNLSEDFFDALMAVHDSGKEGNYKITEYFLYPVGHLAVDPSIHILIQKEAIRKYNLILDQIPVERKQKMMMMASKEASDIMIKLAGQIMEGGDHDFQTALVEALCRMATPDQRKVFAEKWFSMEYMTSAFVRLRDSEFETDCRKFLNLMNGMKGDKRRVYSYPCLEVYLDKYELLMPADENLEEFWIDFNLGSNSISFYFSLADVDAQEFQWETLCITENEVQNYTVTEEHKRHMLQLKLSEVVVVGPVEGSSLTIHFSSSLDILQAASSVFGHGKNKGSVGKTRTSVVKTTIKVKMEENSSQVVPESQVSCGQKQKNILPFIMHAPTAPFQVATPAKMRISESSHVVWSTGAGGGLEHGANSLSMAMPSKISAKSKGKPLLELVRSCDRRSELHLGELSTAAKSCSHGTTSNCTRASSMIEQNIPEAKAVDPVLAGEGEDRTLEHNYVPDTQPKSKNNSSNWSKMSVSEMLMMPTQKISSLPRPEPCSHPSQQQECQPLAQRLSLSVATNPQQVCTDITKRLQQVLSERNQNPAPQEQVALERKMSDNGEDSKDQSSDHQANSGATQDKQTKRNGKSKGSRCQISLKVDAIPIKAPAKAPPAKILQDRTTLSTQAQTNRELSNKDKRDAQVASNMVKLISSHYKSKKYAETAPQSGNPPFVNRSFFNMNWVSTGKREAPGPESLNLQNKTTGSCTGQRKDIFAFDTDEPLNTGEKHKTNTSAISSSGIQDPPVLLSSTKTGQLVAKNKWHVKKHLFSDTETDNAMTEVSWLIESGRKSKSKVTKYSRQAPVKTKVASPHTSSDPSFPKPVKHNTKSNKQPAAVANRPHAAVRRPQRAAATSTKNYKEPDTDSTQSESEMPPVSKAKKYFLKKRGENEKMCSEAPLVKKRKNTTSEQPANTCRKVDSNNQSNLKKPPGLKQRPVITTPETSKLNKRNVPTAQEQMNALKDSWAACQTSCSSPFIETMRSVERSDSIVHLTSSPLLSLRGSPLDASPQDTPLRVLLPPIPHSTVSSKEKLKAFSVHSVEKKCSTSKTQSNQLVRCLPSMTPVGQTQACPSTTERSQVEHHQASLTPSPFSTLPLLTSTLLELDNLCINVPPHSPFPEDSVNHEHSCGLSELSQVSQSFTDSYEFSTIKGNSTAFLASKKEKSSPSDRHPKCLTSGPSFRRQISTSSNYKEDKRGERKKTKMGGEHSLRMKPRKLFQSSSVTEESAESQVAWGMSSHTVSCSRWEAEVEDTGDGDIEMNEDLELPEIVANPNKLCQEFSSELMKKFENRFKMMEVYSKQSLKTTQQHVSSLMTHLTKYRTQKIEKVLEILLEEIGKLEQSHSVLISMEKDMATYQKNQSTAFHSYQEQEIKRNETLKKALQSNVFHSLEYEESLFTSQMCLIEQDMKSVQDRLLTQMQEGELHSVKRSLHALFFP